MSLSPKLPADKLEENMSEIAPRYSPMEAAIEARRCLFCFDAPCIAACPTGIDIPSFIKKISTGNLTGSARVILSANVLGASCGRVCPTEVLCEGACVVLDREGDPIKIGRLQRYATDHVFDNKIQVLKAPETKSGTKVAVIGGGPAGMGCAAELARLGHQAVIFERKPEAGGLNTYGIAYYKMKPEVSLEEVELVKSLGVEFRCGVEVGKDISREQLENEFDAIFIGVGLGLCQQLSIPGEDLPEVVDALDFIEEIHVKPLSKVSVGDRVAVIGCGNTAIDAVTQAKRLGASEAIIIYRRGELDMSAYAFEYDLAKRDGANFMFHCAPLEVIGNGHVSGLRLIRTRLTADGKLEQIKGSEFTEPFDMVIKAVGQQKQTSMLRELFSDVELDRGGTVIRDAQTGQTNLRHIFAGGDCANGGREVVNAVAEGNKAARGIHAMFGKEKVEGPVQPSRWGVEGGPVGLGYIAPIRVPELEALYAERSPASHPQPSTTALSSENQK
jgi:dihydropyrimidine dehydrogenase (NAD+) subunit PreT